MKKNWNRYRLPTWVLVYTVYHDSCFPYVPAQNDEHIVSFENEKLQRSWSSVFLFEVSNNDDVDNCDGGARRASPIANEKFFVLTATFSYHCVDVRSYRKYVTNICLWSPLNENRGVTFLFQTWTNQIRGIRTLRVFWFEIKVLFLLIIWSFCFPQIPHILDWRFSFPPRKKAKFFAHSL